MTDTGELDLRYVTTRKNRNGKVRRYWQRDGQKLQRLPDGPQWAVRATELNQDADVLASLAGRTNPDATVVLPDTIAWAIRVYRETDEYKDASANTKRAYEPWLKRYEHIWGNIRCRGITRSVFVDFLDGPEFVGHRPKKMLAAAVMRNIMNVAHNKGKIDHNPCTRLGLKRNKPRQQLWEPEDLAAFEREALSLKPDGTPKYPEGEAAVRYNMLLLYTGQRPVDVQSMKREHRKDGRIHVVQQKTGKLVWVREHAELAAELAKPGSRSLHYLVARKDGTPITRGALEHLCLTIRRAAGLGHLQQRDLRRTAAVRLAEVGCTDIEIAAITGHEIDEVKKILETYIPRTMKMADNAILKWEGKQS